MNVELVLGLRAPEGSLYWKAIVGAALRRKDGFFLSGLLRDERRQWLLDHVEVVTMIKLADAAGCEDSGDDRYNHACCRHGSERGERQDGEDLIYTQFNLSLLLSWAARLGTANEFLRQVRQHQCDAIPLVSYSVAARCWAAALAANDCVDMQNWITFLNGAKIDDARYLVDAFDSLVQQGTFTDEQWRGLCAGVDIQTFWYMRIPYAIQKRMFAALPEEQHSDCAALKLAVDMPSLQKAELKYSPLRYDMTVVQWMAEFQLQSHAIPPSEEQRLLEVLHYLSSAERLSRTPRYHTNTILPWKGLVHGSVIRFWFAGIVRNEWPVGCAGPDLFRPNTAGVMSTLRQTISVENCDVACALWRFQKDAVLEEALGTHFPSVLHSTIRQYVITP